MRDWSERVLTLLKQCMKTNLISWIEVEQNDVFLEIYGNLIKDIVADKATLL